MGQARQLFRPLALILLMTGCQCEFDQDGKFIYQPNGNDEGCNGVAHGIPCCDQEFADGDNAGDREIFIQPSQYNQSCINTCKMLHPQSVGITESVRQPYFSGPGKSKNKCWCEFGRGKLKINRYQLYRTCMFKEVSNAGLSSASNASAAPKGENEDVGVDRELLMLDFKTVEVSNYSSYKEDFIKVNDSSDCCRACKSQMVTTDKGFHSRFTALFNYDKKKIQCSCFNPMRYGTYGTHDKTANYDVEKIALTRHNSGITSGLCDTDDIEENQRRAGIASFRKEHPPTYHYSDVQGLLGEGRGFYDGNTHFLGSVSLDKTMAHVNSTSCCQECRKKYPESEIFTYWEPGTKYGECTCYNVKDGTRTVTESGPYYAGICEDIGPPVDCSVSHWIPWTKCSKTCGGGIQTRYAVSYQVARRGGTQCQLEEERPCSTQDCPQDHDGGKAGSQ